MLRTIDELSAIELSEVEAAVGSRSFARGRSYARGNRVLAVEWDPGSETLAGSVVGQGALYDTAAYFVLNNHGALTFEDGECTCPIGHNCKHVAAIVIAALGETSATSAEGAHARRRGSAEALPGWQGPLRALIESPAAGALGAPLAVELSLHESGPTGRGCPRLLARPMRPGSRGGWVNGSLSWNGLDSWRVKSGEYRADHLNLLREIHALHRARAAQGNLYYSYTYGSDRTLDLGTLDSPQLWSLLEEAARVGLALVHADPGLGEVPRHAQGELCVDVTRSGKERSLLTAAIRVEGDDAQELEPVLFLGESGHGVACLERIDDGGHADSPAGGRLRLVQLATPAAPQLRRMVLRGEGLEIPASEFHVFSEQLYPALRNVARFVSSDGSFEPPQISAPALVLRMSYEADHALEVGWEWAYQIGSSTKRATLEANGDAPGVRDLAAERAILAETVLSTPGMRELGLLDGGGRPSGASPVSLKGLDSMRFTTQELPHLREAAGIEVEIEGDPADYRDVGESLAIGVSTAEISGEYDWFDLGITISVEGRELPFAEVFVALASGESHMLLEDGAHFSLLEPRLQSLRTLIEEARGLTDSPSAPLRISRYQADLWSELVALGVVTEQAEAWQRQVEALLELDAISEHQPPTGLSAQLRPYQRHGFGWLASLWDLELGGILADDMGLGKTLQVLALICHARAQSADTGPFLVVAPTSVVSNWVGEAARFAPELRIEAITDTLTRSGRRIEDVAAEADVVVTTYTLFRLESDTYKNAPWAGLILDEAQYVKNHQAKTYRCARELPTPFKLAMTGTPMENNLMELWSLLSIAAPGLFPDPKRFSEQYARPIERGADTERLERLRRRVKPLLKRRTKELVAADLPAKQEQAIEVDLHPRHRKLYDTRLQRERQKILGLIDDFDRNRFTILRSITLLRQLSLHPSLVGDGDKSVPCAKLSALVEQLGEVTGGGHRALVFSQFTGFLAMVRDRLNREGIGYCYLDGRTRKRDRVLARFKEGTDPVFLISLKAGGFGLNLTEADYCFLLDPWWNPATEAQAIDRTHRIGQTRPVMVYRMIAGGTIEEKVVALARRKAALFKGVMDEGDLFSGAVCADDIRGLLA